MKEHGHERVIHEERRGTALVTGASRGIGKAIAAALAAGGWEVIGTCRNPKRLTAEDRVPGVRYLPLDFSRKASVDALLRKVRDVDVLVNNAGSELHRARRGSAHGKGARPVRGQFLRRRAAHAGPAAGDAHPGRKAP